MLGAYLLLRICISFYVVRLLGHYTKPPQASVRFRVYALVETLKSQHLILQLLERIEIYRGYDKPYRRREVI